MEVYTFDKCLQERLTEFTEILSHQDEVIPASQIRLEWASHIELVIEPVGWQALWKIPRLTCQDFEIHYPTIVLVEVERVDFEELSALVKIIAVQDEIHLPEKYDVPLIELYPTKNQENSVLDTLGTAICIDQLRFFYNYLWMPWDTDDDDNTDWVASHLESRIRLFFDMKKGEVSKKTCDVIRSLMREGRDIQAKILRLEPDVSDDEEDQQIKLDEGRTCQLLKLHFRLQQIKTEMEVLENPAMREILSKNQESHINEIDVKRRGNKQIEAYFVWLGGSLEETIESLNKARQFLPSGIFMKTSNNLQEALDNSSTGDIIALGEGDYSIRGVSGLEEGGTIKSIGSVEHTIIFPKETESGPCLLDFSGGEVFLENVTINLGELNAGILARTGVINIVKCKIVVSHPTVIKLGIIVLPGAKVIVQNTIFVGLGTAVVVHKTGEVIMNECTFKECSEGIQLQDDSKLVATNCSLTNFKEYGIRLETNKYVNNVEGKIGSFEILQGLSEITLQDCSLANNIKGDIAVKPSATVALANKQEAMVF